MGNVLETRNGAVGLLNLGLSFFFDRIAPIPPGCEPPNFVAPTLKFPAVQPPAAKKPIENEEGEPVTELSIFDISVADQQTSDDIVDRALTLRYRNHRRDAFWEYPGEAAQGWDYGLDAETHDGSNALASYSGIKGTATGGVKISENAQASVSLGAHHLLDRTSSQSETIPTGALDSSVSPTKDIHLNFLASYDFIYPELIQPGAITEFITAKAFSLNSFYTPQSPWRFLLQPSFQFFSDNNVRKALDASLLYGINPGEPWIWLGLGEEYLSYTLLEPSYWSPQRYLAIGPRFEADLPLVGNLSCSLAVNLNVFQQDQLSLGVWLLRCGHPTIRPA